MREEVRLVGTFGEYSEKAITTAVYPDQGDNLMYPAKGLAGESGELIDKLKKVERDHSRQLLDMELAKGVLMECGDILWYCNTLLHEVEVDIEEVLNPTGLLAFDMQNAKQVKESFGLAKDDLLGKVTFYATELNTLAALLLRTVQLNELTSVERPVMRYKNREVTTLSSYIALLVRDIIVYLSGIGTLMSRGWTTTSPDFGVEWMAKHNLEKLFDRKRREKLHGEGDNR